MPFETKKYKNSDAFSIDIDKTIQSQVLTIHVHKYLKCATTHLFMSIYVDWELIDISIGSQSAKKLIATR